eukprot:c9728_g1_i1.p1 GENE.c9728_g1_i1~~c9728_g1_i1.p1  ORF type:complete len:444 (-),score=63.26 c9728_g1_i1:171-1478(-)
MKTHFRMSSVLPRGASFLTRLAVDSNDDYRIMDSNGKILVKRIGMDRKNIVYLKDLFHTLTHVHWWRLLSVFALAYLVTWTVFAAVLYAVHMRYNAACVTNLDTFWDSFLFSIQTQATIGYGNYQVVPCGRCWATVVVISIQSLFGLVLDALMLGLLFTRMTLPSNRAATILFSNNMVVMQRNHRTYLAFRLADVHKEHIVEGHVTLLMYRHRQFNTPMHHDCNQQQKRLSLPAVHGDPEAYHLNLGEREYFPLFVPQVVVHEIDKNSPLYGVHGPMDLEAMNAEFIVMYEGSTATLGMVMQARRSYLPRDVLFGYTFGKCVVRDAMGRVWTDFHSFHETLPQTFIRSPAFSPDVGHGVAANLAKDSLDSDSDIGQESIAVESTDARVISPMQQKKHKMGRRGVYFSDQTSVDTISDKSGLSVTAAGHIASPPGH